MAEPQDLVVMVVRYLYYMKAKGITGYSVRWTSNIPLVSWYFHWSHQTPDQMERNKHRDVCILGHTRYEYEDERPLIKCEE